MTSLCLICLLVSLLIAGIFVANWIVSFKNKHGFICPKKTSAKTFLTPFSDMVAGLFVAITVLFVPIFWYGLNPSGLWSTVFKTLFLSAQNALQLFVVNADFGNVKEMISTINGLPDALADVYTAVVAIYFVIAPLLTAAVALKLVNGLYENWRYVRKRDKKLYIMSELNESSLALARDILVNYAYRDEDVLTDDELDCKTDINPENGKQKRKIKRTLVFANVTQVFQEEHSDLVAAAQELGAICLPSDITEIGLKSPKRAMYRKLFLIGENESVNVDKAMRIIEKCYKNYNFPQTHVYVFGITEESGIVLDSCIKLLRSAPQDGQTASDGSGDFWINVRRVDEKRNLVWRTLLKGGKELLIDTPDGEGASCGSVQDSVPYIFQSAIEQDGVKNINVLIVGLGGYGSELLQTICWFCQMPGYHVTVHAMDGEANCENKIRARSPELVGKSYDDPHNDEVGESRYNLQFHNRAIDVKDAVFRDEVMAIEDQITLAFVTLGDDQTNIDTAIKLSRFFGSKPSQKTKPYILCAVYDAEKSRHLDHGRALFRKGDYRIRFIADNESRFSLTNICQSRLECMGEACHMLWALSAVEENDRRKIDYEKAVADNDTETATRIKEKIKSLNEIQENWKQSKSSYNFVEYNRLSSKARALHLIARETLRGELFDNGLTEEQNNRTIAINEHKRWNAYMRAVGYVHTDKSTSHLYQLHSCLVPYVELDEIDKEKDSRSWQQVVSQVKEMDQALAKAD